METNVPKELWEDRMQNLIKGRNTGRYSQPPASVIDYDSHFEKCKLGDSVLDVGCGSAFVRAYCDGVYLGIDPFPRSPAIVKAEIETFDWHSKFDTVVALQVLDGVYDLKKAIDSMKRHCLSNIILMVRFGIPPDEFHTLELSEELLTKLMEPDFGQTYKEELSPQIFLIEYSRYDS